MGLTGEEQERILGIPRAPMVAEPVLPWASKTVIRILLLVAKMLCLDPEWKQEVKDLANYIMVNAPRN